MGVNVALEFSEGDAVGAGGSAVGAVVKEGTAEGREGEEGGGCGNHGVCGASEVNCFTQVDCCTEN